MTTVGVLGAIFIPKCFDLHSRAQISSTVAIAASLSAANTSNYHARKLGTSLGIPIHNCTDVAAALQEGPLPTGYTIESKVIEKGITSTCTITGPAAKVSTFSATGID